MCASNAPQATCHSHLPEAVQAIVGLLQDDDSDVRQAALNAITELAHVGQSFSPSLMCVSNVPEGTCGAAITRSVLDICELLHHASSAVCACCLETLTGISAHGLFAALFSDKI